MEGAYHALSFRRGIGRHVQNTVTSNQLFLPQTSDRAPTRGAERKERMRYINDTSALEHTVQSWGFFDDAIEVKQRRRLLNYTL